MKIKKINSLLILLILLIIPVLIGCEKKEKWESSLYTPTMIQKNDDTYFIVDCWHHRVIYNDNLEDKISEWKTLTDEVTGAHSIASDGQVYLVDDTDNSAVRVFKKNKKGFEQTQIIDNITGRPHYIMYDDTTNNFYVISSTEQKLYTLINRNGTVEIAGSTVVRELGAYVRSFNIIDGYMYTVSGEKILKLDYKNNFEILESYEVPSNLIGMNYICKIENYFYISTYTNANAEIAPEFVRVKSLKDLITGNYEDLYELFGFKGAPYYISYFDNQFFITEIDGYSGVKSFKVSNDKIRKIKTWYSFKGNSNASQDRKESKYTE
ncbi:hypothetical protein [Anaerosporobacter sp.]